MSALKKVFIGSFIHTNEQGELIVVDHGAIFVENGKISNIIINSTPTDIEDENVIVLSSNQFLIPGFIDCHIHAAQLPNIGIGYDKELLEWLETYTFPLERKYTDEDFAQRVFHKVVEQTIMQGTTTACYFASLYTKASVILGQQVIKLGQRALIGKISMNENRSDGYYENTEDSIKNINKFIEEINKLNSPLVKPIITPRFALSCDMTLMKQLGKLTKEKNLHVQSHVSENLNEITAVKNKFPEYSSYSAVYDAAGLLTNKTVLAHGIYLSDDEIALLKKRGTAVIHCPSSNTCLKSGFCDVRKLKNIGVKLGLGTDVAGGQSSSILDTMKLALHLSQLLHLSRNNYKALNYIDVFHMATLGGATGMVYKIKGNILVILVYSTLYFLSALAMENEIGSFEIIGPAELCDKITEGLHQSAKARNWHISVHQCEILTQILELNFNLEVDFIIFAFDWGIAQSVSEKQT
nr:PREDICTED: guanine deaminase isoform X2 [Megachile rotundata]